MKKKFLIAFILITFNVSSQSNIKEKFCKKILNLYKENIEDRIGKIKIKEYKPKWIIRELQEFKTISLGDYRAIYSENEKKILKIDTYKFDHKQNGKIKTEKEAIEIADNILKKAFPEIKDNELEFDYIIKPVKYNGEFFTPTQNTWNITFRRKYNGYKFFDKSFAIVNIDWDGHLNSYSYFKLFIPQEKPIIINSSIASEKTKQIIKDRFFNFAFIIWLKEFFGYGNSYKKLADFEIYNLNPIESCELFWVLPNGFLKDYIFDNSITGHPINDLKVLLAYVVKVNLQVKNTNYRFPVFIYIDSNTGEYLGGKLDQY